MNVMQLISQFPQFMNQMRGKDPDQMLNEMLSNGRISQDQLNRATQMANQMSGQFEQFRNMFGFGNRR